MTQIEEKVIDSTFKFSSPVTPKSPELQALFDFIALGASERDRDRILPFDVVDLIRRSRLGALRIPVTEGGGGSTARELFEVVIKLGDADPNVAHIVRNHFSVTERILRSQRTERNRRWLKAVADGAIIGLASTELEVKRAGGGQVVNTKLTPDGDGYRLNGTKYYSTGSLYADLIFVRVLVPDGTTAFILIPTNREGIELVDDWDGFGQRLTGTGTTNFTNVRVEAEEVIFETDTDKDYLPYNIVPQLFLTAINAGIIRSVLRDATTLVHNRSRTFYHAVSEQAADDPILQQTVGQISAHAFAAEAIVLAAADGLDRLSAAKAQSEEAETAVALETSLNAAKAKLIVDDLALRSATLLFEVGGASTTKKSSNFDRHWRNARTLSSHNPNHFKARAIGDYEINGKPLPQRGFF
ncbi:putative acyl-CoA dehydrogenase [Trichormus variabilis ATCC 29413]|uniref:Dibenzothiophene monooxygenase n=2 Tax=Anabaena variabilis TaxID=264691 RepID=Q3MH06_TRIV2|nr:MULTISPECIES: acyl-CoA dehydrogenase family protein [Nostocaceae]ABA19730.1 putative acyl-CoA dehydrogenase [Trichormus variabilis ATCC 29413]MBC1214741.1 acyl-CoA dehydrogenase [Trichormus variabilis ARAD]MBC1255808.1 acyl-CoA dehydrogenase [Trichormus variabilis V5]MBC1267389.1 acyl-CoA dehydrogenase [Trichormus variabilis FSR]MBC1303077.1 acyl-CoA dehydrogenase [Trichormus variabilis N2B]